MNLVPAGVRAALPPDDNDLIHSCSPALYEGLREGIRREETWEEKRFRSFVPDSLLCV